LFGQGKGAATTAAPASARCTLGALRPRSSRLYRSL